MMDHIGVIFVGHGTRNAQGISEFFDLTRRIQQKLTWWATRMGRVLTYATAFLELVGPDIPCAMQTCLNAGVHRIVVVPFFLFEAGHMKQDLPTIILNASRLYPEIPIDLMDAIGVDERFMRVLIERMEQLEGEQPLSVLLLGRGNRESSAQREFEIIAQWVRNQSSVARLEVGYLAGDSVNWLEVLDGMAESRDTHILIQPYLWFHGWLTDQIPRWLTEWQASRPCVETMIGAPLGTHPVLVDAMVARAMSVL